MGKILSVTELLLLAFIIVSCATVIKGHNEGVTLTTNPAGAECRIERKGELVAAMAQTPGSLQLSRSKDDISVTCKKPGYAENSVVYSPRFNAATFGNVIAGGLIGIVVDASTGANYNYPTQIDMALLPDRDIITFQRSAVSMGDAIAAAESNGGKAARARFIPDGATGHYVVTLANGGKLQTVNVDSQTSQVSPYDMPSAEPAGGTKDLKPELSVESAKVGLRNAIAQAEKSGGKAIEAGVRTSERGKTTYEMRLVEGFKTRIVWVTLNTGAVTTKS
jgi:hypothetical protein